METKASGAADQRLEELGLAAYVDELRAAWAGPEADRPQRCAAAMGRLLAGAETAPWVGLVDASEEGRAELYSDPEFGFTQLAHRYGPDHKTPPHDHGPGWVVYGVCRGRVTIATYEVASGTDDDAVLRVADAPVLEPGMAKPYLPGQIHSTEARAKGDSIVLRFLSQDLSRVPRHRYSWDQIGADAGADGGR